MSSSARNFLTSILLSVSIQTWKQSVLISRHAKSAHIYSGTQSQLLLLLNQQHFPSDFSTKTTHNLVR